MGGEKLSNWVPKCQIRIGLQESSLVEDVSL